MIEYQLKITLLSDATFGRGDGVPGVVEAEVQHDELGLPYLGGRTLKGLLGAECADILFALQLACGERAGGWLKAADWLFGTSGAALQGQGNLWVGPAQLPERLRAALARDVRDNRWTRADVLAMLTAQRRQTAMGAESGAPQKETLRTMRVVLRGTTFEAPLCFAQEPSAETLGLLAACVKAFRRAGTGRNRGRGRLQARLLDAHGEDVTDQHLKAFRKGVSA
jgi:hypothetical protein